jgi:hypothetical protein
VVNTPVCVTGKQEQVLYRQDTHEEHRLLVAVKEVARQHTHLGWASEFSRCRKVRSRFFTFVISEINMLTDDFLQVTLSCKLDLASHFPFSLSPFAGCAPLLHSSGIVPSAFYTCWHIFEFEFIEKM